MKIIKINSLWCPSCIIMNERVEKIKEKYNIVIEELDYDFEEEKVKKFNPGSILPVLIFLDNKDQEITRLIGEHNIEEIEEILKKK